MRVFDHQSPAHLIVDRQPGQETIVVVDTGTPPQQLEQMAATVLDAQERAGLTAWLEHRRGAFGVIFAAALSMAVVFGGGV